MNLFSAIALFLSGFALGATGANIAYSIFFYIESREKRNSGKNGTDNGDYAGGYHY